MTQVIILRSLLFRQQDGVDSEVQEMEFTQQSLLSLARQSSE